MSCVRTRLQAGATDAAPQTAARRYVMMELAKGKLPDGTRLVSEQNLLRRYVPSIEEHEGLHYGLGLMIDTHLGITVVYNGGDIFGYHSTMIWLPDYNTGAILLS